MSEVIGRLERELEAAGLCFGQKPVLIGGMAMEYYGMRRAGADIDLVISNEDYQALALRYPDNTKDIWGDLGVVVEPFEIWRGIMLFDYDFFREGAVDAGPALVLSLEKLMLTRVGAMSVPKYMDDLKLVFAHYCKQYTNRDYFQYREARIDAYVRSGGTVWGGRYDIENNPH